MPPPLRNHRKSVVSKFLPAAPASAKGLWLVFALLVLWNAFLSWYPCALVWRLEVFFLGFPGLFLWALRRRVFAGDSRPPWQEDFLPAIPGWALAAFWLMAAAVRFYKLTSVPVWPETDEGNFFFLAQQLDQAWRGNLYFNYDHVGGAFFWASALFFKVFTPSLYSLWLFPALLSVATLTIGYKACRYFFSRSFSLIWTMGWAFSFWPLYLGRFCVHNVLVPFFEISCMALLGLCLKSPELRGMEKIQWILLGAAIGLGFYTWTVYWALVALALLTAVGFSLHSRPNPVRGFLTVLVPALVVSAPLGVARLDLPRNLGHVLDRWAFQDGFAWAHYFEVAGSFLTALFWGPSAAIDYHAYKPFGGGFLNPLLGAAFFIGAAEMGRERRQPLVRWAFFAFALLLLPGLLTNNLEMFRAVGALPLLLFGAALGLQALLKTLAMQGRILFLCAFWFFSFGLDFYHLTVVYPAFWKALPAEAWDWYGKQKPCYDAYQVLDRLQQTQGPGLVLNNFTAPLETDTKEQSLTVACFPFDAGRNPGLDFSGARWAAVFMETPDVPFLRKRFPAAQWRDLGPSLYSMPAWWYSAISYFTPGHRYFMMVVPLVPENSGTFERWSKANRFIQEILYESLDPVDGRFHEAIQKHLFENYALFQGDPFLESHFWALVEENLWAAGQPEERILAAIQWGLKRGYPYAEKFHALGDLLFRSGQYGQAREAYLVAGRLDPAYRLSPKALKELELFGKKRVPVKQGPSHP